MPRYKCVLSWSQRFCKPQTQPREKSHLSKDFKILRLFDATHFLITSKRFKFILLQTPSKLDICMQSCEEFDNAKNSIKQKNFNTVFADISQKQYLWHPTQYPFLLIMSHSTFAQKSMWNSRVEFLSGKHPVNTKHPCFKCTGFVYASYMCVIDFIANCVNSLSNCNLTQFNVKQWLHVNTKLLLSLVILGLLKKF